MTNNDVDPAAAPPVGQAVQTEAQDFTRKATDLGALRDAVVDAASAGSGLWFSYLFVSFYLAIAVGSVTHRDLFLQNPVRLPFLNVELPLGVADPAYGRPPVMSNRLVLLGIDVMDIPKFDTEAK